jgi:hypothetical protein
MLIKKCTLFQKKCKKMKEAEHSGHNTRASAQNTGDRIQEDGPAISGLKSVFRTYFLVGIVLK